MMQSGVLCLIQDSHQINYKIVLGDRGKTSGSLWHTRDRISHANHTIVRSQYGKYKAAITWIIDQLITNLPVSYEVAHRDFLAHKNKKLAIL